MVMLTFKKNSFMFNFAYFYLKLYYCINLTFFMISLIIFSSSSFINRTWCNELFNELDYVDNKE